MNWGREGGERGNGEREKTEGNVNRRERNNVCVCERETDRQRERERERQTDRQTCIQTGRQTDRQR